MVSNISSVSTFLAHYGITEQRGFLPDPDPIQHLPETFHSWEALAEELPKLLILGKVRERVAALELLDIKLLASPQEQELAFLVLAILAHSYLNGGEGEADHIPAPIAVPWVQLAEQMQRPPIIKHVDMVLNNWRRIDPDKPLRLDNLRTLYGFHKSKDEEAFFLVTVLVEQAGAAAISAAIKAWIGSHSQQAGMVKEGLMNLSLALQEMNRVLLQMYEHCDPEIFYHQIRPFFDSFHEVYYEGVSRNPIRSYHGGSAAQSSLPPVLDAVLGVVHQSPYLREMRAYMPAQHAAMIHDLEQQDTLVQFCAQESSLEALRREALEELVHFRNAHLKIAAHYIFGPAGRAGKSSTGTGGTNPAIFLKEVRNDTQHAKQG